MKKIKLKNNFDYTKLRNKYALLNNETGKYLLLNESAIQIIEITRNYNDYHEILDQFAKYFGIEKDQAELDLKFFLKKAEDLQILDINNVD